MMRWIVVLVLLLAPTVALARRPCWVGCKPRKANNNCCVNNPEFSAACGDYLGPYFEDRETRFIPCVDQDPRCQPGSPGRCEIISGCVRSCRTNFQAGLLPDERAAFSGLVDCRGRPIDARGRHIAAIACINCNRANPPSTTSTIAVTTTTSMTVTTGATTTVTTTTSVVTTTAAGATSVSASGTIDDGDGNPGLEPIVGRPCFNACLLRIDSLRKCYDRCRHACHGDQLAKFICQRSCRNGSCLAIKARCTESVNNPSQMDPEYSRCCKNSDEGCPVAPDEAECETTTTSTSTSSTTATTSGPTTTSSSTTTSPQP